MSDDTDAVSVGRIARLWRYPVKSMGPEALREIEIGWNGLPGDRRWAFVRGNMERSGFPWLTLRVVPSMAQYIPSFSDPENPDTSPTLVNTPAGERLDVTDPSLGAALGQSGVRVIRYARGIFDTFPLSLITTQTITGLGKAVGEELDVQRFRPNLLVDAAKDEPFQEDGWVGRILRIGGMRMRVDKRDGRCVVITVDPVTGERTPSILRAVRQERQGCLGVYGTTVSQGRVAVNDTVWMEC
jgi:uncharacterized protein YcbX